MSAFGMRSSDDAFHIFFPSLISVDPTKSLRGN